LTNTVEAVMQSWGSYFVPVPKLSTYRNIYFVMAKNYMDKFVRSWYVLHTKSRFENVVNEGLAKKSIDVFLPKIKVRSKRRDRKVMIQVPLFPGYMFVKTDLNPYEHIEIVKTVGAVRIIGNKDGPWAVPQESIESLQIMVAGNNDVTTGKHLRKGDRVMVINGPFAGVAGTFIRYKAKERVVVYIEALGQFASVEVREDDVEIIPELL
jgi:transcription termination/antitermination protein NusG